MSCARQPSNNVVNAASYLIQVEDGKEAKEEPPANAPEAEVQPSSGNADQPAEKA